MSLSKLEKELKKLSDPKRAKETQRYFKTGPGQYGEGDIFIGLTMGQQRQIAKKFHDFSIGNIQELLNSKEHEKRMIGLVIMVGRFSKADDKDRKFLFDLYLKNSKRINNWDLVDISSPHIVGRYLLNKRKERKILYKLAKSKNLWEKRISIISTAAFIRESQLDDTFKISKMLLSDTHDLMHKAVGWMLREAGKKDEKRLKAFLKKNYDSIPRTTLRYAIERFEEGERKKWLKKEI